MIFDIDRLLIVPDAIYMFVNEKLLIKVTVSSSRLIRGTT